MGVAGKSGEAASSAAAGGVRYLGSCGAVPLVAVGGQVDVAKSVDAADLKAVTEYIPKNYL
jgi:hypothetical protein